MPTLSEMINAGYQPKRTGTQKFNELIQGINSGIEENRKRANENIQLEAALRQYGYTPQSIQNTPSFISRDGNVIPNPDRNQSGLMSAIQSIGRGGQPRYVYDQNLDSNRNKAYLEQLRIMNELQNSQLGSQKDIATADKAAADAEYKRWLMTPEGQKSKNKENAGRMNAKDKRTEELFDTFEQGRLKREEIAAAKEAAKNITGGVFGQMQRNFLGKFKPNDKQLGEWQKIKMVLTDAQLMNTAKTKGAISEKEMELFKQAAANDDMGSIAAMSTVFDRLIKAIESDEKAKISAYKRSFGEDPTQWDEFQQYNYGNEQQYGNEQNDPLGVL